MLGFFREHRPFLLISLVKSQKLFLKGYLNIINFNGDLLLFREIFVPIDCKYINLEQNVYQIQNRSLLKIIENLILYLLGFWGFGVRGF